MAESTVLYAGIYGEVESALADLDAFERLHQEEMLGDFDAAVIDSEQGKPRIVRRVDRPGIRVIREWLGSGALPRNELHEAARRLAPGEAALVVVGEATLEKGFDMVVTRAAKVVKRELDATSDELVRELHEASRT